MKRPPLLNNEDLSGKHEEVTWLFSFERTYTQYAIVPTWCRWFYRTHTHTHTHQYTHFRKTREQFEWNSKLWLRIIRIAWWICGCCHCNRDKNHLLKWKKKVHGWSVKSAIFDGWACTRSRLECVWLGRVQATQLSDCDKEITCYFPTIDAKTQRKMDNFTKWRIQANNKR